jgi:mediator of RNA polymerase II transcription subunit 17
MSLAKDVISLYASPATVPSALRVDPTSVPALPYDTLASSSVAKPPSIPSVQSFNARLVAGGKDEALRKASDLFKSAADAVERGHDVGARYWMDALKIRRRNCGLIPAPLPLGAPTGRGADRTTKDFLISFGLSECSCICMRSHADAHSHSLSVVCLSTESNWPTRYIRFQGTNNISSKTENGPLH